VAALAATWWIMATALACPSAPPRPASAELVAVALPSSVPVSPSVAPPSAPAPAPTAAPSAAPSGRTFACGHPAIGLVICESHRETCCEDARRCMPRGAETGECLVRVECQTADDCASGERCCVQGYPSGGSEPYYKQRCQATPCRAGETCRPGGCPDGQVCRGFDPTVEHDDGNCVSPGGSIDCGGVICSGETPYCRWDGQAHRGECVDLEADGLRFACDDASDCLEGERCLLNTLDASECCRGESCFDHAATTRFFPCRTAADCPSLDGIRFTCEPDRTLPPGIHGRCDPHYVRP
jgi:hypothetical protein